MDDVVMLFTDGQPIRRRGEDKFGSKYESNRYGEILLAKDRAQSLRDKNVTVVGLAVGTQGTLKDFKHYIEEWSTKGKYFEVDKDELQTILDKLIKASCCNISRGKQNQNTRFLHIADFKRRKPKVRICDINIKQGGFLQLLQI